MKSPSQSQTIPLEINLSFNAERDPETNLLVPTSGEHYFKVFICYGCQSCWEIVEDKTKESGMGIRQHRPHILGSLNITKDIYELKQTALADKQQDFEPTQPIGMIGIDDLL